MKRSPCSAFALLAAASLAFGARPASAVNVTPCTNPYTGDVYCTAEDAVNGFCAHLDYFRRPGAFTPAISPTPAVGGSAGFLTQLTEDCLCSAAFNTLNFTSPQPAPAQGFQLLRDQLLQVLGSPIAPPNPIPTGALPGTPLLTIPIFGPPLAVDPTPLPVANCTDPSTSGTPPCGPIVSDCFLRAGCPTTGFASCSGIRYAVFCDNCEKARRLAARALAFDMECARILAAAGALRIGSNTNSACVVIP